MNGSIEFEDNTIKVIGAINDKIIAAMHEAAGEIEAAAKKKHQSRERTDKRSMGL